MKNERTKDGISETHVRGVGLKRGIVQIVAYRSEWKDIFSSEAERIKEFAGDINLQVEHIGSTSVKGLIAKPIIDIAIGVGSKKDILTLVRRLSDAGYLDHGDQHGSGSYLVIRESEPGVRVLHIHIVENTDVQWQNYLAFRDCLRNDKRVRNAYARLKKSLAQKFPEDRKSYTDGKDDFVKQVLLKISELTSQQLSI